jgi:hypothetical protein
MNNITTPAITIADVWGLGASAVAELRVFSREAWQSAAGDMFLAGSPFGFDGMQMNYHLITCSVDSVAHNITIHAGNLTSTKDAIINSNVQLELWLFASQDPALYDMRPLAPFSVAHLIQVAASPASPTWYQLAGIVIALPSVPAAPVATDVDGSRIDVVLAAATGAASYKLQRSTNGGAYTQIAAGIASGTYNDTTVDGLTTYAYKAVATNLGGDSAASVASNSITTPAIATPDAPLQLSPSAVGTDIHITSTATPRAAQYEIWRGTASGAETLLDTVTVTMGSALDYHDTTGSLGTAYFFKLKAKNATGTSGFSNELSVTTAYSSVDPAGVSGRLVGYDSDNCTVSTWTDSSSNANHAAQATSGLQPAIISADINGHASVQFDASTNDRMAITTPLTTVKSGLIVFKCDTPDSGANLPAVLGDASGFNFAGNTGTLLLEPSNSAATLRSGSMFVNGYQDAPLNIEKPADWRVLSFKTAGGSLALSLIANDRNTANRTLGARFARIELFDTVLSDANLHGMEVFLKARYNITGTEVLRRQIVTVGDSQSAGGGWQVRAINCLAGNCASATPIADNNWYYSVHALSGYTLADMSVFDSDVAAEFNPHRIKQIAIIWGGTNDLYAGASGATAYSRLIDRVNAYKAAGYTKIIVVNCLKRSNAGTPPGYETERLDYNSRISAGAVSNGYVVADIAAVTNLQDPTNTTYFSDLVHLTGAGQDQMSPVIRDAILSL